MLYFEKSQPAPQSLAIEKRKASGSYRESDVLRRLEQDFKNKCYICGFRAPHSINVEHFRPHRGRLDLKFSWDNLFWACAHCNNVKHDGYDDILDCTNADERVEERIDYLFHPFPFEKVKIYAQDDEASTKRTCELLESVFNGTTELKKIEASNIRELLLKEMLEFQELLLDYYSPTALEPRRERAYEGILEHLHISSHFTPFKRAVIKRHDKTVADFGEFC